MAVKTLAELKAEIVEAINKGINYSHTLQIKAIAFFGADLIDSLGELMNGEFASSDGVSTNGTSTMVQKLRLTTSDLPSGTYRIGYSLEINNSNVAGKCCGRIQINDTDTIGEWEIEPKDTDDWLQQGGFYYDTLDGVKDIDIDFCNIGGGTASIRRARLEIKRVAV